MATQDISRSASDFRKHYHGVQLQQGRVLDDDDFNEADRLAAEVRRRTTVELVGAHGTSNGGFAIADARITAGGELDFAIGAGSLFVGGLRAELEQAERYRLQADWLSQPASAREAPAGARVDLVYLLCWQQPVVAVEDGELFEVALGGPDTSTRIRTTTRIAVRPDVAGDCLAAWNALVADLAATRFGVLGPEHEVTTDARLTVGFDTAGGDPLDLCTPLAAGGYLGAENQTIRVQIRAGGTSFTWGFDNASSLYRATVTGETVTLQTEPKDHLHWPLAGQIVELLPWAGVLPNGEKLAEAEGHLARVSASYDPDTHAFSIAPPPPAGFGAEWKARDDAAALGDEFLFVRVWDRGADTVSPPEIPFTAGTPVGLTGTGLTARFDGADFRAGDHWIMAARPETPNRVVPWRLEEGASPDAVRLFAAPLALVHWPDGATGTVGVVEDCRGTFEPLTECSCGGSCTVVVRPGRNLQAAVDSLPADGGMLCLQAGLYELAAPVRIRDRRRLVVSGAGPATIVRAGATEAALVFEGCSEVEVCALRIEGAIAAPPGEEGLDGALTFLGCTDVAVTGCTLACPDSVGREQTCVTVRARQDVRDRIRIEDNALELGASQTGVLLVDVERAVVARNRVALATAPAAGLRTGGQGIVAGGRRLGSVQILDNLVEDVVQGIHVGVSAPDTPGREQASDVLVSRNVVHLLVPAGYQRERHAVFVGNARSTHVKDTVATLRRNGQAPPGGPTPVEGVRVYGALGPFLDVSQTSLTGFGPVGVRVVPLGAPPADRMWLVSNTMAEGASRGCEAPETVEQERNYPFRRAVLPEALTLATAPAQRTAGQEHTVTAVVTGARGVPAADALVRFAVTGANPTVGTATTGADGKATFAYTGIRAGTDSIKVFADIDGDGTQDTGEPGTTATVAYTPDVPQRLTLTPAEATKRVAVQHCVTATLTDSFGNPNAGVSVRFKTVGANEATGVQKTNGEGKAVFCYTGTHEGLDTLGAFADVDENEKRDVGEPNATAAVTYTQAAESPNCDALRDRIAELGDEIASLQADLRDAVGSQKAAIIAAIRKAQTARQQAVAQARAAGCIP